MSAIPTVLSCQTCGATASERPPIEWVSCMERGQIYYYCAGCARDNLRSIEARLDPVWW